MGLYAEVLHFKKTADSDQARRCCEIYQSIVQHKDRVFPMTCLMEFTRIASFQCPTRCCCGIYQSIEQHKDRVFPMTCSEAQGLRLR